MPWGTVGAARTQMEALSFPLDLTEGLMCQGIWRGSPYCSLMLSGSFWPACQVGELIFFFQSVEHLKIGKLVR